MTSRSARPFRPLSGGATRPYIVRPDDSRDKDANEAAQADEPDDADESDTPPVT